jgi:undecaprenyl phosphate-alpha-L-ara4N flippase subunit ArnE
MKKSAGPTTPIWAIGLVLLCTILVAATQIVFKQAAAAPGSNILLQPLLWLGILMSLVAGVLLIIALKHGELSVLYPVIALGFIWVALVGVFFLGEKITTRQIIGMTIVIVGVSLIGHSGTRKHDGKKGKKTDDKIAVKRTTVKKNVKKKRILQKERKS